MKLVLIVLSFAVLECLAVLGMIVAIVSSTRRDISDYAGIIDIIRRAGR